MSEEKNSGWNVFRYFRKKGARVEATQGFVHTDAHTNLGGAIERRLIKQLEEQNPDIGNIINEYGAIDANAWEKVQELAGQGNVQAQQLIDVEGDNPLIEDPETTCPDCGGAKLPSQEKCGGNYCLKM